MADNSNLSTVTSLNDGSTDTTWVTVTGTIVTVLTALKRCLDVFVRGSNSDSTHALLAIILGTLPNPNFDQIARTVNDNGSETFVFSFNNTSLYQVDITSPHGDYVIKVNTLSLAGSLDLVDSSGTMTTMGGDDFILLEG